MSGTGSDLSRNLDLIMFKSTSDHEHKKKKKRLSRSLVTISPFLDFFKQLAHGVNLCIGLMYLIQ